MDEWKPRLVATGLNVCSHWRDLIARFAVHTSSGGWVRFSVILEQMYVRSHVRHQYHKQRRSLGDRIFARAARDKNRSGIDRRGLHAACAGFSRARFIGTVPNGGGDSP